MLVPAAQEVQRRLGNQDFDGARAALPTLSAALEQAPLTPSARRSAQQAVRGVDEGCGPDAFWRRPTSKRVAVIAAGPGMNVLVAFLIFFAVYLTGAPSQKPSTEVAQVAANTPAAAAGLEAGDQIVAVDRHRTRTFGQVSKSIRGATGARSRSLSSVTGGHSRSARDARSSSAGAGSGASRRRLYSSPIIRASAPGWRSWRVGAWSPARWQA